VFGEQELVEAAIAGNRSADVARVHGLACFYEPRDAPRFQELGDKLGLGRITGFLLRGGVTAVDQHALDQPIHLRKGFFGRVDNQGLETLPLRLPVVPIEAGFDHEKEMRANDPSETLLA
jgi:hypothetical protein